MFSPAVAQLVRDERAANRRTTDQAVTHHATQAVIAYQNREHWPEAEALAALDYHLSQLAYLLQVHS